MLSKKYFSIFIIISIFVISGCAEYSPSIHDAKVKEIVSDSELKKYISKRDNSEEYDISILKSDKKKTSPYASGKLYTYSVIIHVNEYFFKYVSKTEQFDYVDSIARVLGKTLVSNDTTFRGIYDKVIVVFDNNGDKGYLSMSMNIQGIRKLDGKTRSEYSLMYYDKDGKPVYDK